MSITKQMEQIREKSKQFGQNLLKAGVLKKHNKRDITLKSGIVTDVYVNLRELNNEPEVLGNLGSLMGSAVKLLFQKYIRGPGDKIYICGIPRAGVPYATLACVKIGSESFPLHTYRPQPKDHGLTATVDCPPEERRYILIDDVITTGTSALEIADTLPGKVIGLVTLVDRRGYDATRSMLPGDEGFGISTWQFPEIPFPVYSLCHIEDIF